MNVLNAEKNSFSYIAFDKNKCPYDINEYINKLLVDTESKHVAKRNENTDIFFELSKKVNYENTILGIHRTDIIENEFLRIKNMSNSICLRAVRFVISRDGRVWSDNTHWTLAYIYKYGIETKIKDIPIYIIDFRKDMPIIYDCDGVVFDSLADIKNALNAAESIQERLNLGWRPTEISYSIGDLYHDLQKILEIH